MKVEKYLYSDRMLEVKEYNGQLIFEIKKYETDIDGKAAESSGDEKPEKMAGDNQPRH